MTKRTVAVLAGALLCAGAPEVHGQERQVGFKLGLTSAAVNIDAEGDEPGYGRRTALGGGAFLVLPLRGALGLQLEALYTPKGGKTEVEGFEDSQGVTGTLILDYLDVPVLARISAARTSARSFHVFAGPSFGYNLSARSEVSVTGNSTTTGFSDNIESDVANFEVGLVAGGGVDIGRRFVVDARYFWGLTNTYDGADDNASVKNRGLTILAGLRF